MITIILNNTKPQDETGQAWAVESPVKKIPEQPLTEYCLCFTGAKDCDYKELFFFGGSNKYENDYSTFFINKVDESDVIEFIVVDQDTNQETVLNDANSSDYGAFYDESGYQGIYIESNALKAGFPDLNEFTIKVNHTVFGTLLTNESHIYSLEQWSLEKADGTVRIETVNSGRIESGNNYGDTLWNRSVRISGKFGNESPSIEVDNYMNGDRVIKQIQDKITVEYNLETELLPSEIFKGIFYNDMLANSIIISDYNITNVNYKGIEVLPTSFASNYFAKNPNGNYEITFTDRIQNKIKRNV